MRLILELIFLDLEVRHSDDHLDHRHRLEIQKVSEMTAEYQASRFILYRHTALTLYGILLLTIIRL